MQTPGATCKRDGVDGGGRSKGGGAVPCHASVLGIANVACPFCLSLSISFKPLSHVTKAHVALLNMTNGQVALLLLGVDIHYIEVLHITQYVQRVDNWSGLNLDHRKSHSGQRSE